MENTDKQQQFMPINRSVLTAVNNIARTPEEACDILKKFNPNFNAEFYKDCPNLFDSIIKGDGVLYGFVENSESELESFEIIDSDTDITKFSFILDEYTIADIFMDMHNSNVRDNETLSKIADILENAECRDEECEEDEEFDSSEICTRECLLNLTEEYDIEDIVKILEKDGVIIPELTQMFLEEYIDGERLVGITEVQDDEGIHFEYEEINEHNLTKEFDYIDIMDNIVNQYMFNLDAIYGHECEQEHECSDSCCSEDHECNCEEQQDEDSDEYFFATDEQEDHEEQEDEECFQEGVFLPMLDDQVFDSCEMTIIRSMRDSGSNNGVVIQSTQLDEKTVANFKGNYIPALDGIPLNEKECQVLRTIRLLYV